MIIKEPNIGKRSERDKGERGVSESTDTKWMNAVRLDARGLQCPLPVLKARKALLALRPGERLLVEASDPMSAIDFPHYCVESGHRLIATETNKTILRFLIEKS